MEEYIISSGDISSGIILTNNSMTILEGGTANSTTVNSDGILDVSRGGTANGTTLNSGGKLFVSSGGTAINVDWASFDSELSIKEGAYVTFASQYEGVYYTSANRFHSYAPKMNGVELHYSCNLYVLSGTINDVSAQGGASVFVFSGGTANSTFLLSGGSNTICVYDGGVANDTFMAQDRNTIYISSGGTANRITMERGRKGNNIIYVCEGGTANDAEVTSDECSMYISSGGTANNIQVSGKVFISSGGTANNIDARDGRIVVSSGGTATDVKENGGFVEVLDGATVSFAPNSFSGYIDSATVHSGTTAHQVTVGPIGGKMLVYNGGNAKDTVVNGSMVIYSGGTANNAIVESGNLIISSGGKLTGKTVVLNPGWLTFISGATLDFDLTQVAPGAGARINSFKFGGTPNYTITVNAEQEEGIYKLAEIATGFNKTITVMNTTGGELGILTVGETATIFDTEYTLILSDDTLSLQIGKMVSPSPYTSDGLVLNNGSTTIESGEVFHETFLGNNGKLTVCDKGLADGITICSRGSMIISAGGIASNATVHLGGNLFLEAGTANCTTINISGSMFISSGGIAEGIELNPHGFLCISSGGTALGIVENGGFIQIEEGAEVSFAPNTFSGVGVYGNKSSNTLTLHSGTTAYDTTLEGGIMLISSGGTAYNTANNGFLYIYNGGVANCTTAGRGTMFVDSGGTANSTIIYNGQKLYISSGGTAVETTIYSGGTLYVSNGGNIVKTIVGNRGSIYISSGGTAFDVTVKDSGVLFISSGGSANNIVLNAGKLTVENGAVVNGITFNKGASFRLLNGMTITGIIENGGDVSIANGVVVDFVPNVFSGVELTKDNAPSATVHSGTTAISTIVSSRGRFTVFAGGTATDTLINMEGSMYVSSGGLATDTVVNGGSFRVSSEGSANNIIVNAGECNFEKSAVATGVVENGGYVSVATDANVTFVSNTFSGLVLSSAGATVHSGTTANSITLSSRGRLYVSSGGIANHTIVDSGGILFISSGGTAANVVWTPGIGDVQGAETGHVTFASTLSGVYYASDNNLLSSAILLESKTVGSIMSMYVMSGGTTENTIVESGRMCVYNGGTAENTSVWGNGFLRIYSGGMANNTEIHYGYLNVYGDGMANNTTVSHGILSINERGGANTITVSSGGSLEVSSGGTADGATLFFGGRVGVFSGGTATNIIASSGAYLGFMIAPDTYVQGTSDGIAFEMKDAFLSGYTVNSGWIRVSSGGTAASITVNSGGHLEVYSGGTANNIAVNPNGYLSINNGGAAASIFVNSDGQLNLYGGKLTGKMMFENGAIVSTYGAAIVDFDLTQVEAGAEALVNDLSIIQGTPLYTLTVSATLSEGLYLLAEGASTFDQTVSVVNIAGNELGTLTVGETTAIGKYTYALALTGSSLTVDVVKALPPDKPTISVDVSLPTNGNVIVSAEFSEDCVKREYALDGETWQTYIDEIVFSENGSVSFRGIDTAGKVSEITEYEVLNIDKEPPEKPTASVDITTATNKDVTVTAVFSEDSVLKEYSLDGEAWLTYTKAIILENNGIVYFRGTDEVGNTSEIASYEVVNIDRLAPEKPTVSADITTVTNKDVTVTAVFSEDSVKMEYSFDGENWLDYSGGIAFSENGTVMFRGTDAAGNVSEVTSYTVDYIDRLAPEKPIVTADVTTATKGNVKVSAVFSEDSEIKKYSLDGENWRDYTEAVEFTENGTVYFQGTDEAGNPSEIAEYTVANIDKDPPKKPIPSANITTPTNKTVTVTVSFAGDAEQAFSLYRIGEENEWHDYEENGVAITENTTVYFKAVDAAGNESEIASYTVDNIDKVAPEKPFVFASNTKLTNQDITVTAVFSEDSTVKEYSTDGQTWLPYTEPLVVSANGILLFRAKDEAGNSSGLVTFEIGNIDKDVPIITLSGDNTTPLHTSTLSASTEDGLDLFYSTDKENWMKYEGQLEITVNAVYYFTATDAAGNIGTAEYEFRNILPNSVSIPQTQTWEKTDEVEQYTVEYSTDNFEHVIRLTVDSNSLASFNVPAGGIQWRVKPEGSDDWIVGEPVTAAETDNEPKLIKSDEDGNADVFFAKAVDIWESGYLAQHVGSINDWNGTNEYATVSGKNKLADIIEGSTDANILLMTDDDNGDGLFVDDIYTTLPGAVKEQQSRIAQIDEIRAGAGADIVDMTSQNFEYIGDGLTIHGGDGNDTIWANKGDNFLFGDAGNDRIVGASGNDVIAGGIGNDRMHGGGGDDVFTFCENWGVDNVEQLAGGSVTLWFASGSMENWDKTTLTYSDGNNSVKVSGVIEDQIMLKFGDDGSDQFATLSGMGAFFDATTKRIFEESGKGILASL